MIHEILQSYDAPVLQIMARQHGLNLKSQTKGDLARALALHLAQPATIQHALALLSPLERLLVDLVLYRGSLVSSAARQMLLEKKQIAPTRPKKQTAWGYYREEEEKGEWDYKGQPRFEDLVARLAVRGLVFSREPAEPGRSVVSWAPGRYLVIPDEIRAHLPVPPSPAHASVPPPKQFELAAPAVFQRDLARYWGQVRRAGKLELTTQGWVYKKALVELARVLNRRGTAKPDEPRDPYIAFLRKMLVSLELLKPDSSGWRTDSQPSAFLPAENSAFWALSPSERVRATYRAWLDSTHWNELLIPAGAFGYDHRRPAPQEICAARRVVAEHLKQFGAGNWFRLSDLAADLRLSDYEFLFPRRFTRMGYYRYGSSVEGTPYYQQNNPYAITYPTIKNEAEGWEQVEGVILRHMLTGPLHWIGLVDLDKPASGGAAEVFRLSPTGAWILGIGPEVSAVEEGGRVVVQPNFTIVAMEPVLQETLMRLDEFAQFEGGEHALSYRLTRESVYRGQRANWDASKITAYLEGLTHVPLSQNVKRSLEEWDLLHRRITFRRGVALVQADESATLDMLYADPDLAAALGRRAGDGVTLPEGRAEQVAALLREGGWVPSLSTRAESPRASIHANEDGRIEFTSRAPSLYAYQAIDTFVEFLDATHAQITPASLKTALGGGLTVEQILERLASVHHGPLPPRLVINLKAWSSYYGDAHGGSVFLVEFRDAAARQELLADPELAPYLTLFEAGERALVQVREGTEEQARELLRARGIEVHAWPSGKPAVSTKKRKR